MQIILVTFEKTIWHYNYNRGLFNVSRWQNINRLISIYLLTFGSKIWICLPGKKIVLHLTPHLLHYLRPQFHIYFLLSVIKESWLSIFFVALGLGMAMMVGALSPSLFVSTLGLTELQFVLVFAKMGLSLAEQNFELSQLFVLKWNWNQLFLII